MPIYEYRCKSCGEVSEVFVRPGEREPKRCETCDGKLQRLISAAGFQFKGTGWYVTDYARKGKKDFSKEGDPAGGTNAPAAEAKKEAPATGTKKAPEKKKD